MGRNLSLLPDELDAFLEAYVACGFNFAAAARKIGRHDSTIRAQLRGDEEFAQRFAETKNIAADMVYAEVLRRAVDGVDKPVFGNLGDKQGTGIVGTVREYSDALLALAAKALVREFGDRVIHDHRVGVDVSDTNLAAKLAAIIDAARRRRDATIVDGELITPALPRPNNEDLL